MAIFDFVDKGQAQQAAKRGASFVRDFTWKDTTSPTPTPIDLTGYSPRFEVSSAKGSPALLIATIVNGKMTKVDLDGKMTLTFTAADISSLNLGSYYYSLVLDGGPTSTVRLVEGVFEVL